MFSDLEGHRGATDGTVGLDLNYGPVEDVQLTATLPAAVSREPGSGLRASRGDVEIGIKYRFLNRPTAGLSAAIFPRVIFPTISRSSGGSRARLLLPLWGQQDLGKWSLFGGGGFEINPGLGKRNFWQAGAVATRKLGERVSLGAEFNRQGRETVDGQASTSLALGSTMALHRPFALLVSAGPVFSKHRTSYRGYIALGSNF